MYFMTYVASQDSGQPLPQLSHGCPVKKPFNMAIHRVLGEDCQIREEFHKIFFLFLVCPGVLIRSTLWFCGEEKIIIICGYQYFSVVKKKKCFVCSYASLSKY